MLYIYTIGTCLFILISLDKLLALGDSNSLRKSLMMTVAVLIMLVGWLRVVSCLERIPTLILFPVLKMQLSSGKKRIMYRLCFGWVRAGSLESRIARLPCDLPSHSGVCKGRARFIVHITQMVKERNPRDAEPNGTGFCRTNVRNVVLEEKEAFVASIPFCVASCYRHYRSLP